MATDERNSDELEQAHERVDKLAKALSLKFGPSVSVDLFMAAALMLLQDHFGSQVIVDYLRHLATSVENDADEIPPAPGARH
jgi:hypothetical protein